MTKYEYISEIEKNLGDIPYTEKGKILDFYREMIEDKIESGMNEEDAITELGDPAQLADRLREEYRSNNPENPMPPPQPEQVQKRPAGWMVFLVFALVIGSPLIFAVIVAVAVLLFGVAIAIVSVGAAFFVSAVAVGLVGILIFFTSFCSFSSDFFSFLIRLGVSFLLIALCLLLVGIGVGAIQVLFFLIRTISRTLEARKRKRA